LLVRTRTNKEILASYTSGYFHGFPIQSCNVFPISRREQPDIASFPIMVYANGKL
jgi:hypothetical protein